MRLLLAFPYVPTPIRTRPFNFVRFLAAAGHEIHLAAVWESAAEKAELEALAPYCRRIMGIHTGKLRSLLNCAASLPSNVPLQAVYSFNPAMLRLLDGWLREPDPWDAIHVEHLRGSLFALHMHKYVRALRKPIPVIWDSVDCISYLFDQANRHQPNLKGRLRTFIELERTRQFEARMCRSVDQVLVTSWLDREQLLQLTRTYPPTPANGTTAPVTVISQGVDTAYFTPQEQPRQPATLVFSGKMSYHANVAAVHHLMREVMPLVWQANPQVKLQIVGKDPGPEIREYASRFPGLVEVTGTVPDLRPWLRDATAAVVPIVYGAGVQNKVLEAMASGTPVIASPKSITALNCRDGEDLLVRESPAAFAEGILTLLQNPSFQEKLGQAGRMYVQENHSWQATIRQLEAVYRLAPGSGAAPTEPVPPAS